MCVIEGLPISHDAFVNDLFLLKEEQHPIRYKDGLIQVMCMRSIQKCDTFTYLNNGVMTGVQ